MKISEKSPKITDYPHTVKTWDGKPLDESDYFKIVVRPKTFESALLVQDAIVSTPEDSKLSVTSVATLDIIRDRIIAIEFEYERDGEEVDVSTGEAFVKNGPSKMLPDTAYELYQHCSQAIVACDTQSSEDTPAFLAQSDSPAGS